jgi:hypothetical protein
MARKPAKKNKRVATKKRSTTSKKSRRASGSKKPASKRRSVPRFIDPVVEEMEAPTTIVTEDEIVVTETVQSRPDSPPLLATDCD